MTTMYATTAVGYLTLRGPNNNNMFTHTPILLCSAVPPTPPLSSEGGSVKPSPNPLPKSASVPLARQSASEATMDATLSTTAKSTESTPPPPKEEEQHQSNRTTNRSGSNWAKHLFSSWQKGVVTAVGALMGVGALIYILWSPVKADTVNQTADIASQALEDQRLKQTAVQLTKDIVEEILTDKRSVKLLADVLTDLLKEDSSREAVTSFIKNIFEDHYTQEISKKFVLKIVGDPWVLDQLHHIFYGLIVDLLKDPSTKDVLQEVLVAAAVDSLKDKELLSQTGRAVRAIVLQTIWNSKGADPPQPQPQPASGPSSSH